MVIKKVTKKLIDGHKKVLDMSPVALLCRYFSDPKLKRSHLNFLIYLKYLINKNPEDTLYSESMLAKLFNTNETQIKRWKTKLAELGYLTWKRVNGPYIRYYFILPKKVGTKMDVPEVFQDDSSVDLTKKPSTESTKTTFHPTLSRYILSIQSEIRLETEVSNLFLLESQGLGNSKNSRSKKSQGLQDERSESKPSRVCKNGATKKPTKRGLAQKIINHWNSKGALMSHKKAGTKVRAKSHRVLVHLLEQNKYSVDDILGAIDNYDEMVYHSGDYFGVRRVALPDFIQPGCYNTALDKTTIGAWLDTCVPCKAPLTKYAKRNRPVYSSDDPNPELTEILVSCARKSGSKLNFSFSNLAGKQYESLVEVVVKLKRLASEQPSNHNGSSMGINYKKAVEHCLKAADHFFSSWKNVEIVGISPNMLNNDKFWNKGFPEWERENYVVNGLRFPRKI